MIIPESEKSESRGPTARSQSSLAPSDSPPSPPPYSATIASGDDQYQNSRRAPLGFEIPSGSLPNPNAPPAPHPNLPPRCNHLIERKANHSVSGTWHVDTALEIPEPLLPPIPEFDGSWNQETQKARKEREKELKRRRDQGSNRNLSPLAPLVEARPNLMLATTNGAINSQVYVVSSDGAVRQTTIVAQGCNGSIKLKVHASPEQPLHIHATSTNGSVNVQIPSSFEGAVIMSTTWGSAKISDPIKAKLTTFSSTSNTSRYFVGDWQASGFGVTSHASDPNDDPPLPTIQPASFDPFTSWAGPIVHLSSTNGSVSLSYIEEDTTPGHSSSLSKAIWNFMGGWFGGGGGGSGSGGFPPTHPNRAADVGSPRPGSGFGPQDSKRPVVCDRGDLD